MLHLLISLLIAHQYDVISVLTPTQQENDLFGRSVALCSSLTKIVVGASWRNHNKDKNLRSGALFVYDFDFIKHEWQQTQEIYPDLQFNENVTVLNLGDTVEFSTDCNTIIAGAPYSNLKTEKGITNETGSVVIFQKGENENQYQQVHIGIPLQPIAGGGFGRTLAISPDGHFYAAANYNKFGESQLQFQGQVEIHMNIYENEELRWSKYILQPPSQILDGNRYRFGNKIQFLDASTLIVSVDDVQDESKKGIYIYKKKFNVTSNDVYWDLIHEGVNAVHDTYNNIGEAFSMPPTNQDLIALLATNQTNSGVIFMHRNDTTDLWEQMYTIDLPGNAIGTQLSFCSEDKLAITGRMNSNNCLFIYSKNRSDPNKQFVLYDTLFLPEKDQNTDLNLNYLSSFAWEKERCFRFAVGAMSKTKVNNEHIAFKFGRTYIYQSNDFGLRHFITHYHIMPILGVTFFSLLLLIIIGSVIGFYIIKYRKRRQRILMNQGTD